LAPDKTQRASYPISLPNIALIPRLFLSISLRVGLVLKLKLLLRRAAAGQRECQKRKAASAHLMLTNNQLNRN
jgi:hypothetical protein